MSCLDSSLLLGSAQACSVPWLPASCPRVLLKPPGLPSTALLTYFPGEPLINSRCIGPNESKVAGLCYGLLLEHVCIQPKFWYFHSKEWCSWLKFLVRVRQTCGWDMGRLSCLISIYALGKPCQRERWQGQPSSAGAMHTPRAFQCVRFSLAEGPGQGASSIVHPWVSGCPWIVTGVPTRIYFSPWK